MIPPTKREWLIVPSGVVFAGCFAVPVAWFLVLSFFQIKSYQLSTELTAMNYIVVWRDYLDSILFTFSIAFVVAVVVTTVAFAFAYFIRFKAGRFGVLLVFCTLITLFGGYLTKIYVWKTILGASGVVNSVLLWLGAIDEAIGVFLYNPLAVVITLGHYLLPLGVLPIYGSLRNVADTPLLGARDLGASPWRVFCDIVLPQCRVGILFAFTLSFLFSVGDYVTPLLVGGPYTSMLGVLVQLQFGMRFNAPLGAAMAFTAVMLCIAIVGIANVVLKRLLTARW